MKIVPIFVPHLGCPNDCVFCNQRAISGKIKPMTPNDAYLELNRAKEVINGEFEVAFYGGSFTAICESLQDELLDVALKFSENIRVSTRPDFISSEILTRLKAKGVKTIELGIQSMDDNVLLASKRGHTASDVYKACEIIHEHGFTLGAQIMIGLPMDDFSTLKETTDKTISLKPHIARIYPVVVISDTELFSMYQRGEYQPISIEEAVEKSAYVLGKFTENNIKTIRVGLNPTEDLSNSKAIAGAYHEAFGQLVLSKIYLNKMEKLIGEIRNAEIIFGVHPSEISSAVGNKRINTKMLYEKYKIKAKFKPVEIKKGEIKMLR